ncbi:MarR family transcriptional regulator [Virgibacillus phasianinus]|uniref:MarR family transcriptional regulator n=1 Tax=Virgibacillus phasianinus TaxID=2017483 RepID=A0A220U116_9BACI|nr:MarR family transcriptional regulator [Virgibacillus phasianinus]ASK61818.1 MarR family transcriptional regulator [Virgibacillus phasianinus]
MSKKSIKLIENEVTDFIRRIVISEKRNGSLDRSAFVILRQLSTYGPAGVKTLSNELHLDISTVSRQAAALIEKKYVDKLPNPNDGRAYFYHITKLGTTELDANKQRRFERLSTILQDWTEEERVSFGHLLQKYNRTVHENKDW